MTYEPIEAYDQTRSISVGGRTLPAIALVEDQDGFRLFLTTDPRFPTSLWTAAQADGAVALIHARGPREWKFVTAEEFMQNRTEVVAERAFDLTLCHGPVFPEPPPYRNALYSEGVVTVAPKRFCHLHTHSEYSPLDGLSKVQELIDQAQADGQEALAITDHGVCASHPELAKLAQDADIKPVFGIEANFTEDRLLRGDKEFKDDPTHLLNATRLLGDYRHLILWAETDQGLHNLWAASTEANLTGFYGRPRMDWDVLERFSEGVMASTACLRGPLAQAILAEDDMLVRVRLARLREIFGDGLWVELHTNQMEDQHRVNIELVRLAEEYSLPTIAVVDSHYPCASDQDTHRVWIAANTGKSLVDDSDLFAGDHQYHLMSEAEVRKSLDYLPEKVVAEAISQTGVVADRCQARLTPRRSIPVFTKYDKDDEAAIAAARRRDVERLVDLCMKNWERRVTRRNKRPEVEYMERFEFEMKLLIDKSFCGYFLMVAEQVQFAKDNGILVGPGRGSGGGCLVAYLCGITEIDPVQYDLLFERFLTAGRDALPDFDVDYPTSKRDVMQDHCVDRWGADYVMRVGTHLRLKNKAVIRKVAGVLRDSIEIHWPDIDEMSNLIKRAERGSAGLGMKWEDLWDQHGEELEWFREKYPRIVELSERMVGRLNTYGKHAAGMVITTDDPLTGRLPMRNSENSNQPISEFDMDALELLGLIKFDILTLRTLDTLQMCLDLVKEFHGIDINIYDWDAEYEDPAVWEQLSAGHTKGIFQIETPDGTKLTVRYQPENVLDLAAIGTLVRPGPMRSGLTETYLRRRAGQEPVTYVDERLAHKLTETQGVIIFQEQVMQACQILAGYSLEEADEVRRILGKKKVELVKKTGEEFTSRCVEHGMDRAIADKLWEQLGEFAKYSFNKSHALAYGVVGHWVAWFKVHYPSIFLTAVLSTVDKDRVSEFIYEAWRMDYKVLPPDINESGIGFRPSGERAVRYGIDSVKGIGASAASQIVEGQPYASYEDFVARCKVNTGIRSILIRVGAFDSLFANRRALEEQLNWVTSDDSTRCQLKDESVVGPNGLPCRYNWAEEPVVIGKNNRPLKAKPPPKRCTKACRQYVAPGERDFDGVAPYTDVDIRKIEKELLGIYLSSSPFDRVTPKIIADLDLKTAEEVREGPLDEYLLAATVEKFRTTKDRNGNTMAFCTFFARDGLLDVVVFKDLWKNIQDDMVPDLLCLLAVRKTSRGIHLNHFHPVP